MKVIAFTGMPFSGKSEAVHIANKMDIPIIRMGDLVWDEVKNRGLPLNDTTVGRIASDMRKKYGNDIWAQKTMQKMTSLSDASIVTIDGVRNHEEIKTFKKMLGEDFVLVAITVKDDIRFERALKRKRVDDSTNPKKIKERDKRELSWGIQTAIQSADIIISNNESLQKFQKKVEKIMLSLIQDHAKR